MKKIIIRQDLQDVRDTLKNKRFRQNTLKERRNNIFFILLILLILSERKIFLSCQKKGAKL